jgi:hypothetical protein
MAGRSSGRTTRMCRMAHEMSQRGNLVFILVKNYKDQCHVMQHLNRGDGIRVHIFKENTFDWDRMSFKFEHMPRGWEFEKVCVLVDHMVIQSKFPAMIEMYDSYSERSGHPRNSIATIERLCAESGKELREELGLKPSTPESKACQVVLEEATSKEIRAILNNTQYVVATTQQRLRDVIAEHSEEALAVLGLKNDALLAYGRRHVEAKMGEREDKDRTVRVPSATDSITDCIAATKIKST